MAPDKVLITCNGTPPLMIDADSQWSCDQLHPPVPGCWVVLYDYGDMDIFSPDQFHALFVEGELDGNQIVEPEQEPLH